MLHDLFTIGINGKTSKGLNTSASNCMLMPLVAGDAIPISKVLYHCMVSVKCYRGLVKSGKYPFK